jgi:hypothetical protein
MCVNLLGTDAEWMSKIEVKHMAKLKTRPTPQAIGPVAAVSKTKPKRKVASKLKVAGKRIVAGKQQAAGKQRMMPAGTRSYYRKVPMEYVVNYASTLLRQIKSRLGHVVSFTREDLLHLQVAEFEQVATITRYRATCIAVAYLIEQNELIQKKFPDLCLPENEANYHYNKTSVASEYDATIRRLVSTMPPTKPFAIMQVVNRWRTDPQLTSDTKRKAIRITIPRLAREGLCTRLEGFEYVVGRAQ